MSVDWQLWRFDFRRCRGQLVGWWSACLAFAVTRVSVGFGSTEVASERADVSLGSPKSQESL